MFTVRIHGRADNFRIARYPGLIGKRMRWHYAACRCYRVRPFPQNEMSGPASARALGTDRRRRFNASYRALRDFLSEAKYPFSLDPYFFDFAT